jgi:hypothetical protein
MRRVGKLGFGLKPRPRQSVNHGHAPRCRKHFRQAAEKATKTFKPNSCILFEQEIGLKGHIQREMPLFLTLRDGEGNALVTAMLPAARTTNHSSL